MVAKYLQETRHFKLVCRNYKTKVGEVDLIFFDKRNNLLHFVEVKATNVSDADLVAKRIRFTKLWKYTKIVSIFYIHKKKYEGCGSTIDLAIVDVDTQRICFFENITYFSQ